MNAVDTNVVVRLLMKDEPAQYAAAFSVFSSGPVWIAKTVFLETDWVLRSVYGCDESAVGDAFAKLLGLAGVHVEDEECITRALALMAHGMTFADALHLSSRPTGASFVTFDKALVRRAKGAGVPSVSVVRRA